MKNPYLTFVAPIASITILVMGSAAFTTTTSIDLHLMKVSNWFIGGVSSAYFLGLVFGSYFSQKFILRVGHIRAFSAFASVSAALTLLQGLLANAFFWLGIRFFIGYCLAGLIVVIESWLLAFSDSNNRGTVLSLYMVAYYTSQAFGQLLINIPKTDPLVIYAVITVFSALSVVPVAVTRFHAPSPESPNILSLFKLIKKVPIGILGCFVAGMLLGVIYTLYPLFLTQAGKNLHEVSYVMMATILGGTLLQYPLGKISDKMDRRKVLFTICLVACIMCVLVAFTRTSTYSLIAWTFLMGGAFFTIYPVSISHTIDHLADNDVLSATASLLLAFGVGSTLGPLIAPGFAMVFGSLGMFIFLISMTVLLMVATVRRILSKAPVDLAHKTEFAAVPGTSPEVTQLDPAVPEGTQEG